MASRTLRCAVEEIEAWHPQLFLEPHIVACVAVMSRYSESLASFEVECEGITSRWLGRAKRFTLEMAWTEETANKANRLRLTMQSKPLVEMATIALAMVLAHQVVPLGPLDVTAYGQRADFRSLRASTVLEISGTESLAELERRHREKTTQALNNPFGWDAYVVVCACSSQGHRIRFSWHRAEESPDGESEE
jgi:hypothetical protein